MTAVPIHSLRPGDSPRSEGKDTNHVAQLAELDAPLPPILVERDTMRVIDGMHRVMAALLKGQETIDVEFFDGSTDDAFLRAVEANVSHGLPLSHSDRRAAAERIIQTHPHMSDRAIARAAGLGAKTVATIRHRCARTVPQPATRVGRDGRVRPLNSVEGRQRAAQLIAERPFASLREVARLAGISPATVSDVRKRLESGESPVPGSEGHRHDGGDQDAAGAGESNGGDRAGAQARSAKAKADRRVRLLHLDPASVLDKLLRDPSLRHKEEGRQLLRLLQQNSIGSRSWADLSAVVPPHCGALVVELARQFAETWAEFAQELDDRVRSVEHRTATQ
ncbi:transcriptional regulator [Kitasatospora sp. NPDC056181]|uniref:transcriptional regulator n=1 Tax=Kitasatospora sp. NPDC056181 TaxID=3345737 RepID=UPI0035D6114B